MSERPMTLAEKHREERYQRFAQWLVEKTLRPASAWMEVMGLERLHEITFVIKGKDGITYSFATEDVALDDLKRALEDLSQACVKAKGI